MTVNTPDKTNITNHYHFSQFAGEGVITGISTQNPENIGNEPILITDNETVPMQKDGNGFSAEIKYPVNCYKIYYQDTDKYENGGEPVVIDIHKISREVLIKDLINNKKPLQKDIAKGYAEGILITDSANIPQNGSVILLIGDAGEGNDLIELPPNVKAVIVSDGKIDYLSHIASLSRSYFNIFTILYDENKYNELKKLNGEYVHVSNLDGDLSFFKIKNPLPVSENSKIVIPKFTDAASFLDYSELNKNNSGQKACKIAKMQELKDISVLENIIIPKGFIVSVGYIDKIESYLDNAENQTERDELLFDNSFIDELENKCHQVGINPDNSIIRSAFNAEDLYEYPTAGLYDSECCYDKSEFVLVIDHIYQSKDSPKAIESRRRYGIPDFVVQLSVIVQEFIHSDYTFTAYTNLTEDKVLIELCASEFLHMNLEPATIIYDNKTKSLNTVSPQVYNSKFIIDQNINILNKEDGQNSISDNWDVLSKLLLTVSKNALILEKTFGKQQDIEGGISGGKIYFWQTRDIPRKALKHL